MVLYALFIWFQNVLKVKKRWAKTVEDKCKAPKTRNTLVTSKSLLHLGILWISVEAKIGSQPGFPALCWSGV